MFDELFSKSGLSLDRMRNFLLVAEAGSIAKAADGDVIRQSLFSRQIRELETFFGAELTQRDGKGISISKAGLRLAALVRDQLQGLDDFRREQAGEVKEFSLGAGASILEWVAVPVMPRLSAALGKARISLRSQRTLDLVESVRLGKLDFALVRDDAIPTDLPRLPLVKMGFRLCIPYMKSRPMDARHWNQPAAWSKLPMAVGAAGGQFEDRVRAVYADAGVPYRPAVECQSFLQVRQLVETGEYAGILPSIGVQGMDPLKTFCVPFAPLKDYGRTLALHWNERQMERRGVERSSLQALAQIMTKNLAKK